MSVSSYKVSSHPTAIVLKCFNHLFCKEFLRTVFYLILRRPTFKKLLAVVTMICVIAVASTAGAQFYEWGTPEYYEQKRQEEAERQRQLNQPIYDINQ